MLINGMERSLLHRVARRADAEADRLDKVFSGDWMSSEGARRSKLEHDRLRRDARDMRALVKRLQRGAQLEPEPAPQRGDLPPGGGLAGGVGQGDVGLE